MQSHAEFLRAEGGDAELIEAIKQRRWRDVPGLSDRTRALCAVSEKLSASPTRMLPADWEPLRDLGFDDNGLLEVAYIVGIFNCLTRLADGFGLQLNPEILQAAETGVPLHKRTP